jgi:hypothetical protein
MIPRGIVHYANINSASKTFLEPDKHSVTGWETFSSENGGESDKAKVACGGPNKVHHMLKAFEYIEQLLLPGLVSDRPCQFPAALSIVILTNPSSHHEVFYNIRTSGYPETSDQQMPSSH